MRDECFTAVVRRTTTAAAVIGAAGLMAGCGGQDRASTQTAARVNKEEITVHQIGAMLAQQPVNQDQVKQAERQILERLIDRELAVQKAIELKLDREPRVVQAIESSRMDIIARAYADKLGEGAARPAPADIKKYYDENPVLFRDRKIYQLQEFVVGADPKQVQALKAAMPSMRSPDDLVAYFKANGLKFAASQSVRAAEQLPLSVLPALSGLSEGQSLLNPMPNGTQIILVRGTRSQPVDEARASRAIEQFLVNEQKRKLLSNDLQALRTAAKIEYLGHFAASAPPLVVANRAATAADVAASAVANVEFNLVNEGPGARAGTVEGADVAAMAASGVDTSTVNKGLGLK
jgi:EpsD family peptidyl-prolyl cis-trans isomerase